MADGENIPQHHFIPSERRGMTKFSRSPPLLATLLLHALLTVACSSDPGEGGAAPEHPLGSPGTDANVDNPGTTDSADNPGKTDSADSAGPPKPICPQPTRVEEDIDLPNFVSPSFRYKAIDYTLESAVTRRTTVCKSEKIDVTEVLTLQGVATNRLTRSLSLDLELRLILSDGSRLSGTKESTRSLAPEEKANFIFHFKLPKEASLAGARIEPDSTGDAGDHHAVLIPLDTVFHPSYPTVIAELATLEAKTLSPDSRDQWSIKVLSATATLDTDYDKGKHARYGKKYIELIVDAHLIATNVNSLLWYNTFELNVGGFSVYPSVQASLLERNQRETSIILFEVDDDVTEFDFIYDLDSLHSSDDSPDYGKTERTIAVRLPTPPTGESR